jgi:succinate dehydrogenase/fumarate reductase-like Fe-S protein
MMKVDGKTVYACLARLGAREMVVEPLPNKALVKDLVTEVAPSDEELFVRVHQRRG